ncbi:unnamed protein product [Bursaphelenchus xylophilus]|uniref:Lipase n=1 Tax=Bursaphelenchus xylophilus TaxID=6326 RepID=A0A1I7S4D9_BURXY|nr:unnamed protein product [Bursaphelenchus xylophilus]CAG9116992.1 unnamed protein product [Bursaphelenchus xylophilus]
MRCLLPALTFIVTVCVCSGIKEALPEEGLPTDKLIEYWGYPVEKHFVKTEDGYIIEIHRIPHGKHDKSIKKDRPAILLLHGLLESSASYVFNLPHQSPGFVFADNGFDVWIGNVRGNTYGKNHTSLSVKDAKFWQFSWPEHAHKDLPAMFDKITEVTGQEQIYYVGHSQANLILFAHLSVHPEFANRIRRHFALAPVYTVKHIKGLLQVMARTVYPNFKLAKRLLGDHEFMPNNAVMKKFSRYVCNTKVGQNWICNSLIGLVDGPNSNQLNLTRISVYTSHSSAGTSTQNFLHWLQTVYRGVMERYDYRDINTNVKYYNQRSPPSYDITRISGLKMHIFSSKQDWLADPTDMENLVKTFQKDVIQSHTTFDHYAHLDFVWGVNITQDITMPIINLIERLDGVKLK